MRKLILLGAGATHICLLARLAQVPPAKREGLDIALISPYEKVYLNQEIWSILSGECLLDQAGLDLPTLTRAAQVRWYASPAYHVNAKARRVDFAGGQSLDFDVLSVNTGAGLDHQQTEMLMPGARANSAFLHPHEIMLQIWPQFLHWAQRKPLRIAVIGQTQVGFELVCLLAQRLPACRVTWLAANSQGQTSTGTAGNWWQSLGASLQRQLRQVLTRHHVTLLDDVCVAVSEHALQLQSGAQLMCDASWIAAERQAPRWLRASGLPLDVNGFLCTDAYMQCEGDASVFAVGNVTSSGNLVSGFGVESNAWSVADSLLHNLLIRVREDASNKLKRAIKQAASSQGIQLGQQRLAKPLLGVGWLSPLAWQQQRAKHRQLMQKVTKHLSH